MARELGEVWGIPDLARQVSISFYPKPSRRLGLARPARGEVRLDPSLRSAPPSRRREVLAHELAHVVVFLRHGPGRRPHGPEWRALLREAGFVPSRTLAGDGPSAPLAPRPARRFRHTCPVCHAHRRAGRPMSRWRCAACVANGLEGSLVIERESA